MEIKKDEIYVFKLVNGQELIGKIIDIDEHGFMLKSPLSIGQGQKGMEFIPPSFMGTHLGDGYLSRVGVMIMPAREDVVEGYEQSIDPSDLLLPQKKQIITG